MKCSKSISKEKLRIIAGAVVLIITVLSVSLVVIFEIRKSPDEDDEKDKRSLGTTFDCTQKPLCDVDATCTADLRDEKRYICVCNNGFKGNGSVCRGMRVS